MCTEHKRSVAEEIMAQEDPTVRRWKTCVHEAGHAVAGRVMLKRTVKAAVYDAHHGAAYLGRDDATPRTFEEALAVAAGQAAEVLADGHAPPQESPPPPLTMTYPEAVAPLMAQLRQSPRDSVSLARWCIRGIEDQPERWTKRFYWIRHEADLFVARHREEIVAIASQLYERGIVTLEAEPVRPASPEGRPPRRPRSHRSPSRSRRPAAPEPPADLSPADTAGVPPR